MLDKKDLGDDSLRREERLERLERIMEERYNRKPKEGCIYFSEFPYVGLAFPHGYLTQHASDIAAEGLEFEILAVDGNGNHYNYSNLDCDEDCEEEMASLSGDKVVILTVQKPELNYRDVERAISEYFGKPMVWEPGEINPEKELKTWERDQKKRLGKLARGAPPGKLGIRHDVQELHDEEMLEEEFGYRKVSDGSFIKKAASVINIPLEVAEEWALDYAKENSLSGPIYLSNGSWPTPIWFVANMRKYVSKTNKKLRDRVFVAYYPESNLIKLFDSNEEIHIETGEPDILPALKQLR